MAGINGVDGGLVVDEDGHIDEAASDGEDNLHGEINHDDFEEDPASDGTAGPAPAPAAAAGGHPAKMVATHARKGDDDEQLELVVGGGHTATSGVDESWCHGANAAGRAAGPRSTTPPWGCNYGRPPEIL